MEAIINDISDQRSSDALDSLFGGKTSTSDAMLYTAIIILSISVISLVFVIVGLSIAYRIVKKRYRQVHAAPEVDQWRGDVDEFINEAHLMVAIPRASTMTRKSPESQNGDDTSSRGRITDKERRILDELSEEDELGRDDNKKQGRRLPVNQ